MVKISFRQIMGMLERVKVRDITDEFIVRLCQVNPGMLEPGNLLSFNYAINHLPTQNPILEIGSFCGLSTNCLNYYKRIKRIPNKIITCDKWDYSFKGLGEKAIGKSFITGTAWAKFAKETFIRNTKFFCEGDLPWTIEAYSDEFFESWGAKQEIITVFGETVPLGGQFSFCYIDGNHEYNQVKRDFENCHKYLNKGGFILFDDSSKYKGSLGVRRLILELKKRKIIGMMYELILRNPNYLIKKHRDGALN